MENESKSPSAPSSAQSGTANRVRLLETAVRWITPLVDDAPPGSIVFLASDDSPIAKLVCEARGQAVSAIAMRLDGEESRETVLGGCRALWGERCVAAIDKVPPGCVPVVVADSGGVTIVQFAKAS